MITFIKGTSEVFLAIIFFFIICFLGFSILLILTQNTEGQGLEIFRLDKMRLGGFLENPIPRVLAKIRMKSNDSLIQTESHMRNPVKRSPSHLTPTSAIKRVILGRKNQLIRMMKKRNGGNNTNTNDLMTRNRYLRIN